MPFDWKAFVDLARQLGAQSNDAANSEARLRTALSRTYFGAYGQSRKYATEFLQFQPREDVDDHGRLRAHLKSKRRSGDSDRLDLLRQWRNQADYVDDFGPLDLKDMLTKAIEMAERIFASLAPPPRP
jgi:hypothetical protein